MSNASEITNRSVEWSTPHEELYSLPKHTNVSIWLGAPLSGRFMIISNEQPIIDALAQHKWTFALDESTDSCHPMNVDPTSIWQRAEDLVAYTLLKTRKDTKGRLLVPSPEVYFDVVHVVQTGRAVHDLRSHMLSVRLRKIGKHKLAKNKIKNDKVKPEDETKCPYSQLAKYWEARHKRPEDDSNDGVLNDFCIPLGEPPLIDLQDEFLDSMTRAILQNAADAKPSAPSSSS